jgi:hypothetical protein
MPWLKTLRGLEGLDPKPNRWVGRDIVLRQPAKLVGLGKGFDGVLGQHVVAVDQHDAGLEVLVAGEPGWLFGRRFEGLHQSDFFDGEAFAADGDNILWLVFHEYLPR